MELAKLTLLAAGNETTSCQCTSVAELVTLP
jgi:hypothetical protein